MQMYRAQQWRRLLRSHSVHLESRSFPKIRLVTVFIIKVELNANNYQQNGTVQGGRQRILKIIMQQRKEIPADCSKNAIFM